MPGSHWMIVQTPEEFEITRQLGFTLLGVRAKHRRKAERMEPGDRVVYYLTRCQAFAATATITSTFFEDHTPVWAPPGATSDEYPFRVHTRPNVVLEPHEHLDARQIAPRLLYVKRWPAEDWPLAFQGDIHLLSSQDFRLLESEMERVVARRSDPRFQAPRRPHVCLDPEKALRRGISGRLRT
jgi:hypothetical protein